MVLTLENYQALNVSQRKKVKREELQTLIDDHIADSDVATLRGVIRDELKAQTAALEKTLKTKYDSRIKAVEDENDRLKKENAEIKKAISEQQKFLERLGNEKNMDNIFISGIPNAMEIDDEQVNDHKVILNHILHFVNPGIADDDYKILKNFDPREGHDRHSAKIKCVSQEVKGKIFKGCKNFKDLPAESCLKKIWLKNEDTPMQKKENDRLYNRLRELWSAEDADDPANIYKIKSGKLFKNDEVIDTFNLENQIFA